MKILCELKTLDRLNDYLNCEGLIVNTKYSISPNNLYLDDINTIIDWCKKNNKELIFRIDKIITEYELDEIISFIDKYKEYNFIYSDFAIFTYCKRNGLLNHLYYFAQTYLVNYEDINYFASLGIKCLMSNELSLNEINTIIDKVKANVGMLVYGYFPIFYTKRNLLSLYKENCKANYNKDIDLSKDKVYDLKEELRDDLYKIVEKDNGSVIYSCKKMCVTNDLDLEKLDFVYISTALISDEEIKKVLDYYATKDFSKGLDTDNTFKSFLYKTNEIL